MRLTDDPEEYGPFLKEHGFPWEPGDEVIVVRVCAEDAAEGRAIQGEDQVLTIVAVDLNDFVLPYLLSEDPHCPWREDGDIDAEWHSPKCLEAAAVKIRLLDIEIGDRVQFTAPPAGLTRPESGVGVVTEIMKGRTPDGLRTVTGYRIQYRDGASPLWFSPRNVEQ